MNRDDPLENWLLDIRFREDEEFQIAPGLLARRHAEMRAALDKIAEWLESPPKRLNWYDARLWDWSGMIGFAPADAPRAQALYTRLVAAGGSGITHIQEILLNLIAASDDPASVPFWVELLDLRRPRDRFSSRRRTLALAALARLAIVRNELVAYAALRQAAHHAQADVRALAVHYLGRAYHDAERPYPPDVAAELTETAVKDVAFGPRFQARAALREAELPVPLDNPDGVYAFRVGLAGYSGFHCTVELRSKQTLDNLHFAIQNAFEWDADHLYSFFMDGVLDNESYRFSCPHEDDYPPWTDEAVIGELGLTLKHKFLYYFDYGDSHVFQVEVVDIRPKAERGKYPRVVERQGQAPEQYWGSEDDEDLEEDEDFEDDESLEEEAEE